MNTFSLRDVLPRDYPFIVSVYNDNSLFLQTHLAVTSINTAFVAEEVAEMRRIGFRSCLIIDNDSKKPCGLLDFKVDEEAYLSLLMLPATLQGKGLGREIFTFTESYLRQHHCLSIRIDVVKAATDTMAFWERMGFSPCETISLQWRENKLPATVMRKTLQQG